MKLLLLLQRSVIIRPSLSVLDHHADETVCFIISESLHLGVRHEETTLHTSFFSPNKPQFSVPVTLACSSALLICSKSFAAHIIKRFSDSSVIGNCKGNNEMSMTLRCWDTTEKTIIRLFYVKGKN